MDDFEQHEAGLVPKPGDLVEIDRSYVARVVEVDLEDGTMLCRGHPALLQIGEGGWDFAPEVHDAPSRCHMCGYPMVKDTRPYRCHFGDETSTVDILAHWCTECGEGYLDEKAMVLIEELSNALRARYDAKIRASVSPHLASYAREAQRSAGALEHLDRTWLGHPSCTGARELVLRYASDLRALAEAITTGVKMPARGYAGDDEEGST